MTTVVLTFCPGPGVGVTTAVLTFCPGPSVGVTTAVLTFYPGPGVGVTTAVLSGQDHCCTHFLSRMVVLSRALVVLKWDKVKASKRLMLNRSCSQASISSARLIFLCTMENFTGGFCACAAVSRF